MKVHFVGHLCDFSVDRLLRDVNIGSISLINVNLIYLIGNALVLGNIIITFVISLIKILIINLAGTFTYPLIFQLLNKIW